MDVPFIFSLSNATPIDYPGDAGLLHIIHTIGRPMIVQTLLRAMLQGPQSIEGETKGYPTDSSIWLKEWVSEPSDFVIERPSKVHPSNSAGSFSWLPRALMVVCFMQLARRGHLSIFDLYVMGSPETTSVSLLSRCCSHRSTR